MNDKSHAKRSHICKCGARFDNHRHLIEHVGICNPHWPRTSPDDEHAATLANATPDQSNAGADDGVAGALTLDHTSELFRADPTPHTAKTYLAVATEYARDGMIGPDELKHIKAMLEPIAAQAVPLYAETVGERLKRLYPEHYVTIITEMNRQNGPEHAARQLSCPSVGWTTSGCVLQGAFLWGNSQEGYRFWAKLAERERS